MMIVSFTILLILAVLAAVGECTEKDSSRQLSSTPSPSTTTTPPPPHPNIVILFADNLAYDDVGTFQRRRPSEKRSRTPNIDTLAADGMKLKNWNSAAHLCSASRAALLTGRYPKRSGTYPSVYKPDAVNGLPPDEITLAEMLKEHGYATSAIGKWHLGQRPKFLPTKRGFDEWLGVPYHMSGGSLPDHVCNFDNNETMWLPLYRDEEIVQQPVRVEHLASRYVEQSRSFIRRNVENRKPFFLYMAFSHVHQLCAPRDTPEQQSCQWAGRTHGNSSIGATFHEAVEEMDWIAGQILDTLTEQRVSNSTLLLFTSDNGPWVAEKSCSGSKYPFEGAWLRDNVALNCTACPHGYTPSSKGDTDTTMPRHRCILPGTELMLEGVHCGEDTGLGSVWEANLRMPALARWPGKIAPSSETMALVSTLDVVPTILSVIGAHDEKTKSRLDGMDISSVLFKGDGTTTYDSNKRVLFFWRDGFSRGTLPQPFGRFDVAAVKVGRIKAHFYTKSAHYNDDIEVYHDPPLLFDTISDPAESSPLNPLDYLQLIEHMKTATRMHKASISSPGPLALDRDPKYIPCVNSETGCRTYEKEDHIFTAEK